MCSLPSSTGARPTTSLPIPFARSGTAGEADGGNKFDLDSYNSTYFDLLRYTVQQMNARGIWVSVMLWPGAQSDADGGSGANGWDYNPFKAGNNVNSIDGNPTGDNTGWDMESTQSGNSAALAKQDAYFEHVVDVLNDLDGYFYEVANEPGANDPDCDNWERHVITLIRTYESGKAKQHPILWSSGYESSFGGRGKRLPVRQYRHAAGRCLGAKRADESRRATPTPPSPPTSQVQIYDTDHINPNSPSVDKLWRGFMRGYNIWLDG